MTLLPSVERDRRRLLVWAAAGVVGAAAILAGCTLHQRAPAPSGTAPALGPQQGFFFNDDPERPGLVYGVANSDVIDLALTCRSRSGVIEIRDITPAVKGQRLIVQSGAATIELPIAVEADELAGDPVAVANAPTTAPPLTAFRQTGIITVKLGAGRVLSLKATPSEGIGVARFFAACERR
jgi:hypothetical protein